MKYCVKRGYSARDFRVAKIESETAKTQTLSTWSDWNVGEWGRPTRSSDPSVILGRFETFEQAVEAAARADAAFKAASGEVKAAEAVLSAAVEARKAAALSALSA